VRILLQSFPKVQIGPKKIFLKKIQYGYHKRRILCLSESPKSALLAENFAHNFFCMLFWHFFQQIQNQQNILLFLVSFMNFSKIFISGSYLYFLEFYEQNAHPMEQNIAKCIFYKHVLEFHFEPLATWGILNCQNHCTLMQMYVHAAICSCTGMFMHKYFHALVCSCTGTLMHKYVHAHVLSCTGTFIQSYVHAQECSCTGKFMLFFYFFRIVLVD